MANWAIAVADTGLGPLNHTWTLSIEEQFYLVWPAMLAILLGRSRWNGASALLAVAALALASWLMTVGLHSVHAPLRIAVNATPTRAVDLLIGASLSIFIATPGLSGRLARCRRRSSVSVAGVAAGMLLLALVPLSGMPEGVNTVVAWPVISVLTCIVIYASIRAASPLTTLLASRFMTGVGKRSYRLYLWHFPVFVIIDSRWGLGGWLPRLSGLAVITIVVLLSYRFLERPFLDRKNARGDVSKRSALTSVPGTLAAPIALQS